MSGLHRLLSPLAMLALLACGPGAEQADPAPDRPPNIILIVADDLGYGDVCAYSCEGGRTPNLDALAAGGVRFTRGYVAAPVCSQSRAALLTGRYQQRFGHEFTAGPAARVDRDGLGTPASEVLLPRLLRQRGYRTGMVGKWHLGSQEHLDPLARGFETFFGFHHGSNLYLDPLEGPGIHFIEAEPNPSRRSRREGDAILRGREPVTESEYLTEAFTREAVDFIRQHGARSAEAPPFFLYLAYNTPHTPLQVTDRYYDRFPHIADEAHRIFAAMVSSLDDGVGTVVETLRELGIEEQTLILFLSDNGCATYTAACSNGPLLGGKLTHFEGGTRVPFLVQWKGALPPGAVVDTPVSSLDVVPTVLETIGAAPPAERPLDGLSLLPLLRGETDRTAREELFWRNGVNWAMLQDGRFKLVHVSDDLRFVYDLASDPGERNDLAASRPDLLQDLEARWGAWAEGMASPLWPPRQIYISLDDLFAGRRLTTRFAPEAGLVELNL